MPERKLLTVESAISIEGRCVVILPGIPIDSYCGPTLCTVELRRPDGSRRHAHAEIALPRGQPPEPPKFLVGIANVNPDDVPALTEVWIQQET